MKAMLFTNVLFHFQTDQNLIIFILFRVQVIGKLLCSYFSCIFIINHQGVYLIEVSEFSFNYITVNAHIIFQFFGVFFCKGRKRKIYFKQFIHFYFSFQFSFSLNFTEIYVVILQVFKKKKDKIWWSDFLIIPL